jgi:hypothetical protein
MEQVVLEKLDNSLQRQKFLSHFMEPGSSGNVFI